MFYIRCHRAHIPRGVQIRCYTTTKSHYQHQKTEDLIKVIKESFAFFPHRHRPTKQQRNEKPLQYIINRLARVDPQLHRAKTEWQKAVPNKSISHFIKTYPNEVDRALQLAKWVQLNKGVPREEFYKSYKPTEYPSELAHGPNNKDGKPNKITLRKSLEQALLKADLVKVSSKYSNEVHSSPSGTTRTTAKPVTTTTTTSPTFTRNLTPRYQLNLDPNYVSAFTKTTNALFQETITTKLPYEPIEVEQSSEIPTLKHNLSRVLFSPGVHYLQDPRSKVYNFDPYLKNILPVNEFDFQHITKYVTSEKDQTMLRVSKLVNTRYYSSTSSMTGVLSQLHFFLSNFRPVNLGDFSRHVFPTSQSGVTKGAKLPAVVIVRQMGDTGCYAIDSDKSADTEMILSRLGHSLERLLTTTPEDFDKYKVSNKSEENSEAQKLMEQNSNAYHYAKMGDFLMRSQLDCVDDRLPGTGTFDLKTRAVCAVRHDVLRHETETTGYEIVKSVGQFESFERELLELARSTMLKYSLQARIGNMDGILIAFHNIAKIFGFQYLPLSEIDKIIHSFGKPPVKVDQKAFEIDPKIVEHMDLQDKLSCKMAKDEFTISMDIYQKILNMLTTDHLPNTSFRLIVKAMPHTNNETQLFVLAHPVTNEEIDEIQSAGLKYSEAIVEASKVNNDGKKRIQGHVNKLNEMNQRLGSNGVKGFSILVDHKMNAKQIHTRHPNYNKLTDNWEVDIKITELTKKTVNIEYKSCLNQKSNLLLEHGYLKEGDEVTDYVKLLRAFSEKGKKRSIFDGIDGKTPVWNRN